MLLVDLIWLPASCFPPIYAQAAPRGPLAEEWMHRPPPPGSPRQTSAVCLPILPTPSIRFPAVLCAVPQGMKKASSSLPVERRRESPATASSSTRSKRVEKTAPRFSRVVLFVSVVKFASRAVIHLPVMRRAHNDDTSPFFLPPVTLPSPSPFQRPHPGQRGRSC